MTDNTLGRQFLAFIAVAGRVELDPAKIAEGVRQRAIGNASEVEIAGEVKSGHPLILQINKAPYTVMPVDRPLPADAYAMALKLNRSWPNAAEIMAKCQSHLVVAPLRSLEGSHATALQAAVDLTRLCATLAETDGAKAVVWTTGDVLVEAPRFSLAANELVQKRIPVMSWIGIIPVLGPKTATGEPTFGMLTSGLLPFVGREIEFPPTTMKPEEVAKRVIGFAHMLVLRGAFIKDGETIGLSSEEFIVVRDRPQGQRPLIPVFSLSLSRE